MTNAAACGYCKGKVTDSLLCNGCTTLLRDMIEQASVMLAELAITATRQSRMRSRLTGGGRNASTILPFDERAAALCRRIDNMLAIAAVMMGWNGYGTAVRWLLVAMPVVRQHEVSVGLMDKLKPLLDMATEVIDQPAQHWYAGACEVINEGRPCGADLWGVPDDVVIVCHKCSTVHNVRERKVMLLRMVEETLATATEIAKAVHIVDMRVTDDMVWTYAKRGRITARGINAMGEPMYRIGDVLSVVREAAQRRVKRNPTQRSVDTSTMPGNV
jgi:hypothetical protein